MASANTAGNHQSGVLRIGRPIYKVQELNTSRIGTGTSPWQTIGRYRNETVAEHRARAARIDNGDTLYRTPNGRALSLARVKNLGRTAP